MSTTSSTGLHVTGIDATTYLVKDTDRAISFYRDVLGMDVSRTFSGGAEFDLSDGSTFGLWNPAGYMPWQPCTGVLFAVDDFRLAFDVDREPPAVAFVANVAGDREPPGDREDRFAEAHALHASRQHHPLAFHRER